MMHPDKLETGDWVRYKIGLEHGRSTVYDFGVIADAHPMPHIVKLESGVMIRTEDITEVRRRPITDADITLAVTSYLARATEEANAESVEAVRRGFTNFARWFVKVVQHE